jgi:hypothetical protein
VAFGLIIYNVSEKRHHSLHPLHISKTSVNRRSSAPFSAPKPAQFITLKLGQPDPYYQDLKADVDEQVQLEIDQLDGFYTTYERAGLFKKENQPSFEEALARTHHDFQIRSMLRLQKQWLQTKKSWLIVSNRVKAKARAISAAYSSSNELHLGRLWILVPINRLLVSTKLIILHMIVF